MGDTPRSANSSGTPRDDRFFSPRENSSRSARSSSSSEGEWLTPRQHAVQSYRCNSVSSDDQYFSARNSYRGAQDADFVHHQQQHETTHQYSQSFDSPRVSVLHQMHRNQQSAYDLSEHDRRRNFHDNQPDIYQGHGTKEIRNRNDPKYDEQINNLQWSGAIRKEDVESIFTYATLEN